MYQAPMTDWRGTHLFVGDFVALTLPYAPSLGTISAKITQFFTKVCYNMDP